MVPVLLHPDHNPHPKSPKLPRSTQPRNHSNRKRELMCDSSINVFFVLYT